MAVRLNSSETTDIFEVAFSLKRIEDFYGFCVETHQYIGCSNEQCNISLYIDSL